MSKLLFLYEYLFNQNFYDITSTESDCITLELLLKMLNEWNDEVLATQQAIP